MAEKNASNIDPEIAAVIEGVTKAFKEISRAAATPESFRKRIDQINASNIDGDKTKLSPDESRALLAAYFSNPPIDNKLIPGSSKHSENKGCEVAALDTPQGELTRQLLGNIPQSMAAGMQFNQGMAKSIEGGDKKLDKKLQLLSEQMLHQQIEASPLISLLDDETKKLFTEKMGEVIKENTSRIKDMLKKNPDIRADLINLPDISELGRLKSDDVCKAMTGKHIGLGA